MLAVGRTLLFQGGEKIIKSDKKDLFDHNFHLLMLLKLRGKNEGMKKIFNGF